MSAREGGHGQVGAEPNQAQADTKERGANEQPLIDVVTGRDVELGIEQRARALLDSRVEQQLDTGRADHHQDQARIPVATEIKKTNALFGNVMPETPRPTANRAPERKTTR
ncbi:hypothetical protein Thiowin_03559 [Thiorhodovibrio winogradskyi]|uniref:Uncharacterized protein n=1 Tax=Thiorhodovibrio winogradskyi TaxID=77007 RepID=A0ABZ0SBU0_9GAMM|nr:hypothetical protein [Thiorhodovibrio winogradskyi]